MKAKLTLIGVALVGNIYSSFAQQHTINVSAARFAQPLIERLVGEYQKSNPNFSIAVSTERGAKADAQVVLTTETSTSTVGRYIILPIANSNNQILQSKKLRKGFDADYEREVFFKSDDVETLYAERTEKKAPLTVYALTGAKSVTSALFAKSLNAETNKLKGKKILGSEENALTAVLKNDDAISFNVANLVYCKEKRSPIDGLQVLPVDIDGNGRISEAERQAFGNIDALTSLAESTGAAGLAIGNVGIETNDSELADFVNWVSTEGQSLVKQLGYLRTEAQLRAQK